MRPFVALDTATDHLALAIGDLDASDEVVGAVDFPAPRAANTVLLLALERLLGEQGLSPRDLAAVAVGRGPGSFTGVRIGVATAKGIAHGLGCPLVGFGTLDAIVRRAGAGGLVGVLGDAMRGEVYPALFRVVDGDYERLNGDRIARPSDVAAQWAARDERVVLTGGGLVKHRQVFEEALGTRATVVDPRRWSVDGPSLVAAAWAAGGNASISAIAALDRAAAYARARPQAMLPVYTRLSDAEEAERLRAGRADDLPDAGVAGPAVSAR